MKKYNVTTAFFINLCSYLTCNTIYSVGFVFHKNAVQPSMAHEKNNDRYAILQQQKGKTRYFLCNPNGALFLTKHQGACVHNVYYRSYISH